MSENRLEISVGAAVLLVSAAFLFYLFQNEDIAPGSDRINLVAVFTSAEGIAPSLEVKMLGIKIGSVSKIELDNEMLLADVHMSVRADIDIPDDSSAKVVAEGLLGGTYMTIVPGGSATSFEDGGEITQTTAYSGIIETMTNAFVNR